MGELVLQTRPNGAPEVGNPFRQKHKQTIEKEGKMKSFTAKRVEFKSHT